MKWLIEESKLFFESLDPLIRPAVEILNNHGFETFESCQGGSGHSYPEPTIRFFGNEFDLIRAYEVCQCYKLNPIAAKRVYRKTDEYGNNNITIGIIWDKPFNEITFAIHSKTRTMYLPD